MRIIIIVNSLQAGGAERAALRLAESFDQDGHEVILATWSSDIDFYKLDKSISRINLGNYFNQSNRQLPIIGKISGWLKKFHYLREIRYSIIDLNPDVVICFEALIGSITAISLATSRVPLIISERVNPNPDVYLPHRFARLARPLIYRSFATCSVQTQGFSDWVLKNWKVRAVVTPNHIPKSWISESKHFNASNKRIVSIGRIEPQKGFDILLKAWEKLGKTKDEWSLEIVGSQHNSDYLNKLIGLSSHNVKILPPTHEVLDLLDNSTIFVSSSRFEGFPNVVLEALSRGIPTIAAISTDVVKSWAESDALIAYEPQDVETLVLHLKLLMNSPKARAKLSTQAINVAKNYNWDKIQRSWYQAINQAIQQKLV